MVTSSVKKKESKKKVTTKFKSINKFRKSDIPKLNYGMIHSQFGYPDGVSIVMKQVEHVMTHDLNIPKSDIYYLVGKSSVKSPQVRTRNILWDPYPVNKMMINRFKEGYGGHYNEKIELAIAEAKEQIEIWVTQKKIDVIIAHNASHPVNFISSIALSRYYRDSIKNNIKTPKYLLWWHDAHTERSDYLSPSSDVHEYLLEGVPGKYVEYILFINSTQFSTADKYFRALDLKSPGFYKDMEFNHDVVYNTTDTFIDSYEDLESDKLKQMVQDFLEDYSIPSLLHEKDLSLSDVLFVLQHTRVIPRKRIDFALQYSFELWKNISKRKYQKGNKFKALYFFISGHTGHNSQITKKELKALHRKLCKENDTDKVFLVFSDDKKTTIKFEEFPKLFAKLGGIATYFSEIEGFGNNLLEVLASGLIPIVYTYPVFKEDISKFKFKCVALDEFIVEQKDIDNTIEIIRNNRKRKIWVNRNLEILRKNFKHKIIERKLQRAIIRTRLHK